MSNDALEQARRAQAARQADLDSYRDHHHDEELVPGDVAAARAVEQRARKLAAPDPSFGPALAAYNQGMAVLALDRGGRPLRDVPPTRDLAALCDVWQAHPGSPAGVASGEPYGLVGLALDSDGWSWLTKRLTTAPPETAPSMRSEVVSWQDERPRGRAAVVRDPGGLLIRLAEQLPPTPRFTMRPLEAASPRLEPRTQSWLAWAWPAAGTLPRPGRVAGGARLVDGLPCDGAAVELDGVVYGVQSPGFGTLARMPEYVVTALGGKPVP